MLASVALIVTAGGAVRREPGDEVEGAIEGGVAEPDLTASGEL